MRTSNRKALTEVSQVDNNEILKQHKISESDNTFTEKYVDYSIKINNQKILSPNFIKQHHNVHNKLSLAYLSYKKHIPKNSIEDKQPPKKSYNKLSIDNPSYLSNTNTHFETTKNLTKINPIKSIPFTKAFKISKTSQDFIKVIDESKTPKKQQLLNKIEEILTFKYDKKLRHHDFVSSNKMAQLLSKAKQESTHFKSQEKLNTYLMRSYFLTNTTGDDYEHAHEVLTKSK